METAFPALCMESTGLLWIPRKQSPVMRTFDGVFVISLGNLGKMVKFPVILNELTLMSL